MKIIVMNNDLLIMQEGSLQMAESRHVFMVGTGQREHTNPTFKGDTPLTAVNCAPRQTTLHMKAHLTNMLFGVTPILLRGVNDH